MRSDFCHALLDDHFSDIRPSFELSFADIGVDRQLAVREGLGIGILKAETCHAAPFTDQMPAFKGLQVFEFLKANATFQLFAGVGIDGSRGRRWLPADWAWRRSIANL